MLIRVVLGAGAFAVLFIFARPGEIWRILAAENLAWLGMSFALLMLVMVVRAWRWWWLLADFGMPMPYRVLLELILTANYFNLFCPGGLGGDVYRAYGLSRYSAQALRPVATVVIERFTGIFALFLIGTITAGLAGSGLPVAQAPLVGAGLGLMGCTAAGLIMLLNTERYYSRLERWLPGAVRRRLPAEKREMLFGVFRDLRGRPRAFLRAVAIGVILQLTVLTTYYAMSLTLHGGIAPEIFYGVFPVIELASMVPITISGLGVREGLMVWFLKQAEVAPSFSMGLALINRLLALAMGLLGGAIWLVRSRHPFPAAGGGNAGCARRDQYRCFFAGGCGRSSL